MSQNVLNFVKYFVQCHPRFRNMWNRHLWTFILLFMVFLIVFSTRDLRERHEHRFPSRISSRTDDQIIALKAQLGYLKRKYSEVSGKAIDVNDASMPTIFVVTPTYHRPVQKAELSRLCHTFVLVPNLHWIVVEDSKIKTDLVTKFLQGCGVKNTHLNVLTPPDQKLEKKDKHWSKPRGVIQRNEALHWLRDYARSRGGYVDGVIYFADDDNTYSTQLFEEMRDTKGVSVWPVAFTGGLMVEKPKIGTDPTTGQKVVVGWDVSWGTSRPFAIDMAGFAVNYNLFLSKPKAKFAYHVKRGHQETEFLRHLVSNLSELEPKASMCSKVYVWHTRTNSPDTKYENKRQSLLLPPSHNGIEI